MSLYLDTNVFLNIVYAERGLATGSAALLGKVQAEEVNAVTSAVTLLEIVLDMAASGLGEKTETAVAALEGLRGLRISPLDASMSKTAAKHALDGQLTIHDAYHLATALHARAASFVTRDRVLAQRIRKHIAVLAPEDALRT